LPYGRLDVIVYTCHTAGTLFSVAVGATPNAIAELSEDVTCETAVCT
jgi:hypothetical protein